MTKEGPPLGMDPEQVYDDNPGGIGMVPPSHVPGERIIKVTGLHSQDGFVRHLQEGPVATAISDLHRHGKALGARWSDNEVILYVAKHKTAIISTITGLGVATGIGMGIYLLQKHRSGKYK